MNSLFFKSEDGCQITLKHYLTNYYATSVVLFAVQLFLLIALLDFYNDLPLHNTLIPHPCSAIQALIKLARQTRSVD